MPEEIIYTQWRNANDKAKYPFSVRATLNNGTVSIAEETFIDARLYPPGVSNTLHLSRITKDSDTIEIVVSTTTSGEIASALVDIADIVPYNLELLELHDVYGRSAGVLVTDPDRLGLLTALPIGTHTFSLDQTEFAATVVTPSPQTGLKSVVVDDEPVYGEVWLVGGLGVVLEHEVGTLYGDDIVTINVVGEPLSKRTICQDEYIGFDPSTFLEYIVVDGFAIHPDDFGDLKIGVCGIDVDDTILRVLPSDNGLTFAAVGGRVG